MKDDTNIRYLMKLNIGELNWKLHIQFKSCNNTTE